MNNLITELLQYTDAKSNSDFSKWHYHNSVTDKDQNLSESISSGVHNFLLSTMDEVRLRHALVLGKNILKITDLEDSDYFRRGLLRREFTGDISYSKQRDHSAHTMYNYLLGWYIFSYSPIVKSKLNEHFLLRSAKYNVVRNFGNVWPLVSILHDVGYLFEGSINPLNPSVQSQQILFGIEILKEYFNHQFWVDGNLDSMDDRNKLRNYLNIREPEFEVYSMSSVADSLRSLGSLELLRKHLINELSPDNESKTYDKLKNGTLPEDTFDLWEYNYAYFGQTSMKKRITLLRSYFEYQMSAGFAGSGLRLLDHGVCSGLLLLLYTTFYFRMYFGVIEDKELNKNRNELYDKFLSRPPELGVEYTASWWWKNVIWATAATAMHNFFQSPDSGKGTDWAFKPLDLDEDPLAYLGILVDCIQEWDRYSVSGEPIVGGQLPVQGIEMSLGHTEDGKITIVFNGANTKERNEEIKKITNKVRNSLTGALLNWEKILIVR